jgi:hypothetical protein
MDTRLRKGWGRMSVMITSTGVYLILAVVFLIVIGGGVILAYFMSKRSDP